MYSRIPPPVDFEAALGVNDGEEYDDHANRDAGVEGSGQDVVVTHPPSEVPATHAEVKDKANEAPGHVVDPGTGGDGAEASEANWNIDVAPEREGEAPSEKVEGNGGKGADGEEPQKRRVSREQRSGISQKEDGGECLRCSRADQAGRSDSTPN